MSDISICVTRNVGREADSRERSDDGSREEFHFDYIWFEEDYVFKVKIRILLRRINENRIIHKSYRRKNNEEYRFYVSSFVNSF